MNQSPLLRTEETEPKWPAYWALLLSLFVLLQSVGLAFSIPRGNPPDEMAHIAYVRDAAGEGRLLPDYANGRILDSKDKNYLEHPPLYYSALGMVSRALGIDPVTNYVALRILSAGFVGIGFLFWLLAFRNLGASLAAASLATLACCAVPMFGYVAGSINNDTLAYLGVALAVYGLSRFRMEPDSDDALGLACFAAGIITAFLTKATVAAFLTFFLAALGVMRPKDLVASLRNPRYLWAGAAIVVACGTYYLYALLAFGSLFPKPRELYAAAPPANPEGLLAFCVRYVKAMWERLPVIMSHASIQPMRSALYPVFHAMLLLPLFGWLVARPGARARGSDRFCVAFSDAFFIALLVTICVNILVTYRLYLHIGLYAGWQPRYFAFAIPAAWLLMFLLKPTLGTRIFVLASFALCASVSFWGSVPYVMARQQTHGGRAAAASTTGAGSPFLAQVASGNKQPIYGQVDDFKLEGGRLYVRGWAFDSRALKVPRRIWAKSGDTYLGSTAVTHPRPDVEKSLNQPAARNSGFQFTFDGAPAPADRCRIALFAELDDASRAQVWAPPSCTR